MTDKVSDELVERLRKRTTQVFRDDGRYYDMPDNDCHEAADRLASLSDEVEMLRGVLGVIGNQMWAGEASELARAALDPPQQEEKE